MYEKRIDRLLCAMDARGADAALISSRENMFYFSGFTGETGALLITHKSRTLFVEQRYALQASMETEGFSIVNTNGGLYNSINDTILGDGVRRIIFEDSFFTVSSYRSLRRHLRYEELIPAGDLPLRLRAVKDQAEIAAVAEAASLTDAAFAYIVPYIKVGAAESDLSFKAEMFLRSQGADGLPFKPVIVSGARTAIPSAISGAKEIAFGDIIVVNMGIIYKGYCTDCSRTYFMGSADERGRSLYEAVSAAAADVRAEAKAAACCRSVETRARTSLAEAGFKDAYRHSVGHGTGLSPRELPYLSLQSTDTLCSGMTLSLGVGAYQGGFGGARITDTVCVTADAAVCLTKTPDELAVL